MAWVFADELNPMAPVVDRGWAWAVLVGVHVSVMLSNGYLTTLGIFYNEWKDYFDASATASSWLVSIPWLVACPISFFVGILSSWVGIRRVSMIGATVMALATVLGSFTTHIGQLYVCNAMSGVGAVMVVPPGAIILTHYFKTRYVFANGIAVLGLNIAQVVFPPLLRLLIARYGWRGAMFIIGALQMHGVAACALFRPLKTKLDKAPSRVGRLETESLHDVDVTVGSERRELETTADCPSQGRSKAVQKLLGFLKVFTDVPALLLLTANSLQSMGLVMNLTHLPARATEAGWSDTRGALLVLAFGVASSITRSFHGWFVDRGFVGPFKLQLIVLLGTAVTAFLNPVSDSYAFLVSYAVLLGVFLGVGVPLLIANMKTIVSAPELPAALSLMWATFYVGGVGSITAGKIFDATGNYLAPFLTGGAMFLAAFLLFAVVTVAKRRQDSRH